MNQHAVAPYARHLLWIAVLVAGLAGPAVAEDPPTGVQPPPAWSPPTESTQPREPGLPPPKVVNPAPRLVVPPQPAPPPAGTADGPPPPPPPTTSGVIGIVKNHNLPWTGDGLALRLDVEFVVVGQAGRSVAVAVWFTDAKTGVLLRSTLWAFSDAQGALMTRSDAVRVGTSPARFTASLWIPYQAFPLDPNGKSYAVQARASILNWDPKAQHPTLARGNTTFTVHGPADAAPPPPTPPPAVEPAPVETDAPTDRAPPEPEKVAPPTPPPPGPPADDGPPANEIGNPPPSTR